MFRRKKNSEMEISPSKTIKFSKDTIKYINEHIKRPL